LKLLPDTTADLLVCFPFPLCNVQAMLAGKPAVGSWVVKEGSLRSIARRVINHICKDFELNLYKTVHLCQQ
jgi:hypothetical protein